VIGVDASPDMLAQARKRLPDVDFHEADLHRLPLADNAVDTVVCALALTHVPDLAAVLAEFARVLRPGGSLVISDAHLLVSYLRPTLARRPGPDGRPSLLTEYHRPLSAYLAAALPLGFQVRRCEEPRRPRSSLDPGTAPDPLPAHVSWDLLALVPGSVGRGHGRLPDRGRLALPTRRRPKGLSDRTGSFETGHMRPLEHTSNAPRWDALF
jgi:SAM-dependent methyltransferase